MPHTDRVHQHARWPSGWSSGRSSYAWLLPFGDQQGMRRLVNSYQYALRELPGFDLVPLEWLHIVVQEVGFTDAVPPESIGDLLQAAQKHLQGTSPLQLTFHAAKVLSESLALPAEPAAAVPQLRSTLRQASASVVGSSMLPAEPAEIDTHVNLAMSTSEGPSAFASAVLSTAEAEPTVVDVPAVSLVRLNRDHSTNEWETVARVPFGG